MRHNDATRIGGSLHGLAGHPPRPLLLEARLGCAVGEWREKQRVVLAGDAWIADGNYHETLDLRLERADTLVVVDMPWWLCSGRALVRGCRMPGELPDGCDYSAWARVNPSAMVTVEAKVPSGATKPFATAAHRSSRHTVTCTGRGHKSPEA
jgi:hypothetical protein